MGPPEHSPPRRHLDPEAVFGFAVPVRRKPFPLEPDPEAGLAATLARPLPAETAAEAVTGLAAAALVPSPRHIQAEHQPRLLRLRKTPAQHRLPAVLRQPESHYRRARVAPPEHRKPVTKVRRQPPVQIVVRQ